MKKILIVDDHQGIRESFGLLLREHGYDENHGYQPLICGTEDSLDFLGKVNPDLAILGIEYGDDSILREIRKRGKEIPIYIAVCVDVPEETENLATEVLKKPVLNVSQYLEILERHVGKPEKE